MTAFPDKPPARIRFAFLAVVCGAVLAAILLMPARNGKIERLGSPTRSIYKGVAYGTGGTGIYFARAGDRDLHTLVPVERQWYITYEPSFDIVDVTLIYATYKRELPGAYKTTPMRICSVDLTSGHLREITNVDSARVTLVGETAYCIKRQRTSAFLTTRYGLCSAVMPLTKTGGIALNRKTLLTCS